MGNSMCNERNQAETLVLQTGRMRGKHIEHGVDSLNMANSSVIHRWLPSEFESKYESLDFVNKFKLNKCDFINIYDDTNHLLKVTPFLSDDNNQTQDYILDNINIIVACGSSSLQAFKLTRNGPKVLLPISQSTKDDSEIGGNKNDTNLMFESLNFFGGTSGDTEQNRSTSQSVIKYLHENAFREDANGVKVSTNIIVVNQLGYSILGFNPRNGDPPPLPSRDQKIVPISTNSSFTTNNNKTQLITVFQDILASESSNRMYLVARQCKVMVNGTEEELAGQWATRVHQMIQNESVLKIRNATHINRVLDLGGGSGTFYIRSDGENFVKDNSVKEFMKSDDLKPNQFEDDVDTFVQKFNESYNTV